VECIPLPLQTAEMVAKAAANGFLSRFGCPLQIHTDQGRNFDSALFKRLCELLEITKTRTTPYRPCSNGQVERYNRTLLQLIRCFVKDSPKNWDEHLSQLTGAINSTVNRQIGYTPNQMMLGREVRQPIEIMLGTASLNTSHAAPPDYVQQLQQVLQKTHELARCNLQSTQKRQKRDYDIKLSSTLYQKGDLVYKLDSSTKVGQSSKLKPVWKGPLLVTEVISPVLYRIRDKRGEKVIHHDRLKLCRDRVIPMWMRRLRHRFLETGSSHPDPTDLLDQDEDLNLDLLFKDQDNVPKQSSRPDPDKLTTDVPGNVINIDPPMAAPTSRRQRTIRLPRYLRDYTS
jgi:hypothetical protein